MLLGPLRRFLATRKMFPRTSSPRKPQVKLTRTMPVLSPVELTEAEVINLTGDGYSADDLK